MLDTIQGRRVCDHEIWSRKNRRWQGCLRPARVTVPSKRLSYMEMDFCCERHKQAYLARP
jgi:hypothetical protein